MTVGRSTMPPTPGIKRWLLMAAMALAVVYLIAIPFGLVPEGRRISWEDLILLVIVLFFASDLPQQLRQFSLGSEGISAEFEQLTRKVEEQDRTISDIQFLLNSLVTDFEYDKLKGLAGEGPYRVRHLTELEAELRRLRAMGFIRNYDGVGLTTIRRRFAGTDAEFDLKDFFFITERGRDYMGRRQATQP